MDELLVIKYTINAKLMEMSIDYSILKAITDLGFSESTASYIKNMLKGGTYLLELPTGAGKTSLAIILSIISAKYLQKKVLFYTRTHRQIDEIYKRTLLLTDYFNGRSILVTPVLGKEILCPMAHIYGTPDPYELCSQLRSEGSCRLFNKFMSMSFLRKDLSETLDLSEMIEKVLSIGVCPYYFINSLIPSSNIILSTYFHLFNLPQYLSISPFNYVIVIDEFHNIPIFYSNYRFFHIPQNILEYLLDNISKLDISIPDYGIQLVYRYIKCKDTCKLTGENVNIFSSVLSNIFYHLNDIINREKLSLDETLLDILIDIFPIIYKKIRKIIIKNGYIYFISYPIEKLLKNLFTSSFLNLFISATLSPNILYSRFIKRIFGIETSKFINSIRIFEDYTPPILNMFFIKGFSSKYPLRNKSLFENLANIATKIILKYGSSIIFTPSKDFAHALKTELDKLVLINKLNILVLENIGDFYKSSQQNVVIILSQRSKFSEGVNIFRDIKINNVIIVGITIPSPSVDVENVVRLSYGYTSKKYILKYGYIHQGLLYLVQSIGRIISGKKKTINIFVLEDRLRNYLNSSLLPDWFKKLIITKELSI